MKRVPQLQYPPLAMDDATSAAYLGLSLDQFKAINLQPLPYTGFRNRRLWSRESLEAWFKAQGGAAQPHNGLEAATA